MREDGEYFLGTPCKIVKPRNHIPDPLFSKVREGGEYNLSAFSVGELISPANLELIGDNNHHFKITWVNKKPLTYKSGAHMYNNIVQEISRGAKLCEERRIVLTSVSTQSSDLLMAVATTTR